MSESRYNIVFEGQVVGGADPAVVKQNLAKVFKMDLERVEKLFSGKPVVLKKDADKATAMKFRAVMKKAGAQCEMRAVDEARPEPPQKAPQEASPPRERASFAARDPETRPLSEEAAEQERRRKEEAARAEAEAAKAKAKEDDAGDAGSDEPAGYPEVEEIEAAPPPEPAPPESTSPEPASPEPASPEPATSASTTASNTASETADQGPPPDSDLVGTIRMGGTGFSSEFDVAPPGADIGEEKHLENVADPDISHLSMAPPGTELEQLTSKEKVEVPDISHLKVVTPEDETRERGDS